MLDNSTGNIEANKLKDDKEKFNDNVDRRHVKPSTFKKIARPAGSVQSSTVNGNTEHTKDPL